MLIGLKCNLVKCYKIEVRPTDQQIPGSAMGFFTSKELFNGIYGLHA